MQTQLFGNIEDELAETVERYLGKGCLEAIESDEQHGPCIFVRLSSGYQVTQDADRQAEYLREYLNWRIAGDGRSILQKFGVRLILADDSVHAEYGLHDSKSVWKQRVPFPE
ncbi:hypothetical protein UCREL1_10610 [Eutypa lata UCREL1]|uniref:Uncharacterized protein n=1 Tax=Eutypa lata (strain UCR-EL1) TaxID=1287681 RepID=M7SE47_EUTLA|nr:hypothetical protein UCREL1_10610 [Eutypa lata UCREL1]